MTEQESCYTCQYSELLDEPAPYTDGISNGVLYGYCNKNNGRYNIFLPGARCKDFKSKEGIQVSEELQEVAISNPEWYANLQLEDAKEFIRSNMASASRSFIAIGYYLKYIKANKLYEQDGYSSIWDFAQNEFNISRTWAGRWMSINDRFSKDGNSPILLDQYEGFSASKLAEMLQLTDNQLGQVVITTTVAQIRDMKQPEKDCAISHIIPEQEETLPASEEPELMKHDCFIRDQINNTGEEGLKCSGGIAEDCNNCDKSEPENDTTEFMDSQPETVNDVEETTTEEPAFDFPCDTCGHDINGCCDYDTEEQYCVMGDAWISKEAEREQVEVVEADIIQTVPADEAPVDYEEYSLLDVKDEQDKLTEYVDAFRRNNDIMHGRRKAKMRLDAITLLAEEMQRPAVVEEPEPVQPDLPILKNNDQRKVWIEAYTTWPIWIDLEQTGERYYRYDLSDKVAMVVKVSKCHVHRNYKETADIDFEHEEYYLLGIKTEWHSTGMVIKEDNSRTFFECSSNKSALVDYLREFQKKK